MAKKYFVKKRASVRTPLRRQCNILIALYILFVLVCGAVCFIPMLFPDNETAVYITVVCMALLFLAGSLALCFILLPVLRVKQAKLDIANYDFTPVTPDECEGTFENVLPIERYYFDAAPFDEDEKITLNGGEALGEYLAQYDLNGYKGMEFLGRTGEFTPFYLFDFSANENNTAFVAEKKMMENGQLQMTLYAAYSLSFTPEGITANGKSYSYSEVKAMCDAMFTGFASSARIFILLGEDMNASFAIGGKIMALLDKYGVRLENREVADYIMNDPPRAFRQIALQTKLRKLK